jgi:hypothetical protein
MDCGGVVQTMFAADPAMAASLKPFSDACEATFVARAFSIRTPQKQFLGPKRYLLRSKYYGKYILGPDTDRARRFFGSGGGRCDDAYWSGGLNLLVQKCPNPLLQTQSGGHIHGAFPDECTLDCKAVFLPFYHECEDRIAAEPYQAGNDGAAADDGRSYANFLAKCQAVKGKPKGGGH